MSKFLILDKSVLHGTSTDDLLRFVETHTVILPETLLYECLTTNKKRDLMLDRYRKMLLSGGVVCPTLQEVVHFEATSLKPYGPLVDLQRTDKVRQAFAKDVSPYDHAAIRTRLEGERDFASDMKNNLERCRAFFKKEEPDQLREEIKHWGDIDASRCERLREYTQTCDSHDLHDAANQLLPRLTPCREKYCLSEEWVSWQSVRVFMVWQMERAILHQARGRLKQKDLEDDWADVQYVTLLSRADGLLMHDPFWQLLAKAAFPEKDVFSSLQEVPESYRCGWVQP